MTVPKYLGGWLGLIKRSGERHTCSKLLANKLQENEGNTTANSHKGSTTSKRKRAHILVGLSVLLTVIPGVAIFRQTTSNKILSEANPQSIFENAIEIDKAVDGVDPTNKRREAIETSRKSLGCAIARLANSNIKQTCELRKRLIRRLLELGGAWFNEAERQIILLDCEPADPHLVKLMALAVVGQVEEQLNDDRQPNHGPCEDGYWDCLAHQKAGEVLLLAADLNPGDVDLIAKLIEFSSCYPKAFESADNEKESKALLANRIGAILNKLCNNTGSRSRLIRYRFDSTYGDHDDALTSLKTGLATATQRLTTNPNELSNFDSIDGFNEMPIASLASKHPIEFWDYLLIAEVANSLRASDPTTALEHYEVLMSVQTVSVPRQIVEEIYLSSGELAFSQSKTLQAKEIWKAGVEKINSDSLPSLYWLTKLAVQEHRNAANSNAADHAANAINRFRNSIELAATRLANSEHNDSFTASRRARALEIQRANWQANVLEAKLKSQVGQTQAAIDILKSAVCAQVEVSAAEKISATHYLAHVLEQNGESGNAAAALDRAVELSPSDMELRIEAAAAWARAGNRARSSEHLKQVGRVDSLKQRDINLDSFLQAAER